MASRHLSDLDRKMYRSVYNDFASGNGRIGRREAILAAIELGIDENEAERRFRSRVSPSVKLEDVSEMEFDAWLEMVSPDPALGLGELRKDLSAVETGGLAAPAEVREKLRKAFEALEPNQQDTVDYDTAVQAIHADNHLHRDIWEQNLKADAPGNRVTFSEFLRVGLMIHD